MRRLALFVIFILLISVFTACGNNISPTEETVSENTALISGTTTVKEEISMRLFINNKEIPVEWEDNAAVKELTADAAKGDITVQMSMYSDNEQVGSLGKSYTAENKQTTTHNGDIVLYNSSNIVVFYGSNSWSYTRLGKMNLPEKEVTELLSKGNVTVSLR